MSLTKLTKITGPGISSETNWVGVNANYTGILTAASLGGIGNLNSTGIITASSFRGDGSQLTGIDATALKDAGGNVKIQAQASGAVYTGIHTFTGDVSIGGTLTYEDLINVDSVGLGTFREGIFLPDNKKAQFGNSAGSADLEIYHSGSHSVIRTTTNSVGDLNIRSANNIIIGNIKNSGEDYIKCIEDGQVELHFDNVKKLETSEKGIKIGAGVTIETNGQATFVGVVTFGSSSTTIDGDANTIKVGTALTLGHTQGLQFHTQNLHSEGFEINNRNASGIITATQFKGDGSNLTGLASREFYGFTGIGNSLRLTTTNSGADNIDGATYAAFEESFTGPSGISFSINTSGNLIMSV